MDKAKKQFTRTYTQEGKKKKFKKRALSGASRTKEWAHATKRNEGAKLAASQKSDMRWNEHKIEAIPFYSFCSFQEL